MKVKQTHYTFRVFFIIGLIIFLGALILLKKDSDVLGETTTTKIREYHIHMGSGASTETTWHSLTSTTQIINSNNYPGSIVAKLYATVLIPNGNMFSDMRLYNETDKYPIFGSTIRFDGGGEQFLSTNRFALPVGEKKYSIQIKNQIQADTKITNSTLLIYASF